MLQVSHVKIKLKTQEYCSLRTVRERRFKDRVERTSNISENDNAILSAVARKPIGVNGGLNSIQFFISL